MRDIRAYQAMIHFLDGRYDRLPSDALASLLSDMMLLDDGRPADPAIAVEWEQAVEMTDRESAQRDNPSPFLRKAG